MHDLCVVFDVDDTLYLERDYVASGFRAVGAWVAEWLSIADFDRHCLDLFEGGQRGNVFDAALRFCDFPPNEELVSALVAIYRSHAPQITLIEDVACTLPQICRKWPVAVITDGPVISQSRKCEALAITQLARPIVLTGTRGINFHKPQVASFQFVASQVKAKKYVYVADNPDKDFTAPRQLGWHSVRIRRKGGLHYEKDNHPIQPEFEMTDFTGLLEAFTAILKFQAAAKLTF